MLRAPWPDLLRNLKRLICKPVPLVLDHHLVPDEMELEIQPMVMNSRFFPPYTSEYLCKS